MRANQVMAGESRGRDFWTMDAKALYSALNTSEKGLSQEEAAARIRQYGYNSVPDKDRREWLDILISQVRSPLLLILIFASLVSAYMGDIFDTGIILVVISASVLLGFLQEYKSERALSELKKYFVYHASPIRGGERMQLDARELVPGDVVSIGLGDIVPADIRIMETKGIDINEGVLTGESREVRKSVSIPRSTSSPQEITNGLFMGTTVVDGYALGVVVATGKETFFGRTAAVFSAKVPESDFQFEMRKFGSMLFRVIVVLTLFVFLSNFALGHGDGNALTNSALFALALAVGIAPEALPAVITIALSGGSLQLAKRKVIVKKLAAIEDLGNIDVLCTDKTGTLTEGDINAERFVDLEGRDSRDVFLHAFLCNAAVGSVKIRGNAIDAAIRRRGLMEKADVSGFSKVAEIPFDFRRRRMGQVISDGKNAVLVVKGAPESVLPICGKSGAAAKKTALEYTAKGYTTIAVAVKAVKAKGSYSVDDESGMELEGFILLSNPPKHSVRETLERLQKLNVRLKILTGDDPQVTRNVCGELNFCGPQARLVLGRELEGMDEAARSEAVENCDVFARVAPEQKLLIVETLRKNGHIVGFLGDGINDASALRTADVGISVDTAADVAKGASHIILLKKSLNVVCDGIEGGRKVFGNITKYILNTMSANQGNMITVAITSLFLPFIPLLPSQILLNNMLSDLPMLSISSDNVDSVYTRKPQKWNLPFILRFMVFFGLISTVFDFVLVLTLYFVLHADVDTFRTAWFLESVLSEMIIVYSLRTQLPAIKSVPSRLLIAATLGAMVASTAIIYIPLTASWFHFVPLGTGILLMIAGILVAYFAVTELGKALFFHWAERKNHNGKIGNHAVKAVPHALRAA
jgi:Mg2+-importing ATPase